MHNKILEIDVEAFREPVRVGGMYDPVVSCDKIRISFRIIGSLPWLVNLAITLFL